jgi:hypothetical protein
MWQGSAGGVPSCVVSTAGAGVSTMVTPGASPAGGVATTGAGAGAGAAGFFTTGGGTVVVVVTTGSVVVVVTTGSVVVVVTTGSVVVVVTTGAVAGVSGTVGAGASANGWVRVLSRLAFEMPGTATTAVMAASPTAAASFLTRI